MKKVLYFAYGSNMCSARLAARVDYAGPIIKRGLHTLKGWALGFNIGFHHSFANILPDETSEVTGVLYELNEEQFRILDKHEALYYRHFFDLPTGELACVYVGIPECVCKVPTKPHLEYLNVVIDGAIENGIVHLAKSLIEYKKSSYTLRKKNRHENIF